MFCWELAKQIKRDVLPPLQNDDIKLFAIGIGSAESAKTFADQLEFPAQLLFADDSDDSDAYAAAGTRNTKRDANGKQIFEGVDSMWSSATTDALAKRGKDDLDSVVGSLFKPGPYKPLMPKGKGLFDPKAVEKTFVQGGTFIYDGSEEIFAHYDAASGVHADLDEVVRVATAARPVPAAAA